MANIDERVVKIGFDGNEFKRGADTTLKTIEKLNQGMQFKSGVKGLENVGKGVENVKFDVMNRGLESVKSGFDTLTVVGVTALGTIANKVTNLGLQMGKQLVFGGFMDGFREYELLLNSTQTVLANTEYKGENIQTVNKALDQLNEYADLTIYNFGQMAQNIGMFTAAGVDLDDSVSAIKGMSNLAALQGAQSSELNRAMYQTSQAMSAEYFRLMDWRSIQNAGMGGEQFKRALKMVAANRGTDVDAIIAKAGSFEDSLAEGWLSRDVMTETLTAISGDLDEATLKTMGYSEESAKFLANMGATATEAATKIKTFSQLMEVVQEGIGSGWAQTFRLLFGDLEQAREFWTAVSEPILDFIEGGASARNKMLTEFNELGGRETVIRGLVNIFQSLGKIVGAVRESFRDLFPRMTADKLFEMAQGFETFTERLVISDKRVAQIKGTFDGLFSILRLGWVIAKGILSVMGTVLSELLKAFSLGSGTILGFTSALGNGIEAVIRWIEEFDIFGKVATVVSYAVMALGAPFLLLGKAILAVSDAIQPHISEFLDRVGEAAPRAANAIADFGQKAYQEFLPAMERIETLAVAAGEGLKDLWNTISSFSLDQWNNLTSAIGEKLPTVNIGGGVSISDRLLSGIGALSSWITSLDLSSAMSMLDGVGSKVSGVLSGFADGIRSWAKAMDVDIPTLEEVVSFFKTAGTTLVDAGKSFASGSADRIASAFDRIKSSVAALKEFLAPVGDFIKEAFSWIGENLFSGETFDNTLAMATNAGILYFLYQLKDVIKGFGKGLKTFVDSVGAIGGALEALGKTLEAYQTKLKGDALLSIAKAIALLAGSVFLLSMVDPERLWASVAALGAVSAIMGIMMGVVTLLTKKMPKTTELIDTAKIMALGGAMVGVATAVLIVSVAMKSLSGMSTEEILKGTGVVLVVMGAMALVIKAISTPGLGKDKLGKDKLGKGEVDLLKASVSMVFIAIAVERIGKAIDRLGGMDTDRLKKGGLAVVAILASLTLFSKFSGDSLDVGSSLAVIGIAGGFLIFAKAVEKLGNLEMDTLRQGVVTIVILASAMGLMIRAISMPKMTFTAGSGLGFLLIAASLLVIGKAIQDLGMMDTDLLVKGGIAAGLIMGAMTLMATAMGKLGGLGAAKSIGTILALAFALNAIMGPMLLFSTMDSDSIKRSLTVLAGLSGILLLLTGGLAAIGTFIGPGLIGVLLSIGGAIALIGAGFMMAGLGVSLFAAGLAALAVSGSAGIVVLVSAIRQVISLVPYLAEQLAHAFVNFTRVLGENAKDIGESFGNILEETLGVIERLLPKIASLFKELFREVLGIISELAPEIIDTVLTLLDELLGALVNFVPKFIDHLSAFISAVANKVPDMMDAVGDLIVAFIDGISTQASKIIEAGADLVVDLLSGLETELPRIAEAAVDLIEALAQSLADQATRLGEIGLGLVEDLITGFVTNVSDFIGFAGDLLDDILSAIEAELDSGVVQERAENAGRVLGKAIAEGVKSGGSFISGGIKGLFGIESEVTAPEDPSVTGGSLSFGGGAPGSVGTSTTRMSKDDLMRSLGITTGAIDGVGRNVVTRFSNAISSSGSISMASGGAVKFGRPVGSAVDSSFFSSSTGRLRTFGSVVGSAISTGGNISTASGGAVRVGTASGGRFGPSFRDSSVSGLSKSGWAGAASKNMSSQSSGLRSTAYSIGVNAGGGLGSGIKSAVTSSTNGLSSTMATVAANVAQSFAGSYLNRVRRVFGIQSPSREMMEIGIYLNEGFGIGLEKSSDRVSDGMTVGVLNGLGGVSDALRKAERDFGNIQSTPTITPVLDLDGAIEQADIFREDLGVRATYELAAETSQQYEGSLGNSGKMVDISYTQNITSQKPLSTMEIYRHTKNQVNQVRKLVGGNVL